MTKPPYRALPEFVTDDADRELLANMIVIAWLQGRDNRDRDDAHAAQTSDPALPLAVECQPAAWQVA